jgi:competence protein ComEC
VLASGLGALRSRAATTLDAALSAQSPDPEHRPSSRPSPGRALLAAMLLGEREPGLDGIETAFRRLGLVHLVAISGFNLAIVAGLVLFFLRLGPDRPVLEPLIVATLIILYMLVVPGEAPILRSGLTVLTFLAAETSGRRYDRLNLLGWIAVLLILFRPLDLFSLGFQLSFGIVAALLWLGRHAQERFFGVQIRGIVLPRPRTPFGHARRSFVDWAKAAISTSVLAWAVAIPTIAYHTGLVSPLAAITSILILPLVVVSLWIGYTVLRVYPSVGHGGPTPM